MAFRFKQFSVDDSQSAMKVGTDSVLLGAWADFTDASSILDIGTGCGILALMAAQKSEALITGIDIDGQACHQASDNFLASPWLQRLNCIHMALEHFDRVGYDHIITNPPYFINSLKSPHMNRNNSRHSDNLPLNVLMERCSKILADNGKLSIVFPYSESRLLMSLAENERLTLSRKLIIIPKESKAPNRVLIEFKKGHSESTNQDELIIRDKDGKYTLEYINLTAPFYLHLS